jgi:hypothetical protein
MSELVSSTVIESIVGVKRHQTAHYGRAVSAEQQVYILHSVECIESVAAQTTDLRLCPFARAADTGIDMDVWGGLEDRPVRLRISAEWGDLEPVTDRPDGSKS